MRVLISLKKSIIFLVCSILFAGAVSFLLRFLLSGPVLWPHFDFLLSKKTPVPVSTEILIIDTDEYVSGSDLISILMTLTEMDASKLILMAKVTGSSSLAINNEDDVKTRFYDEYNLIKNNIRNFFEAIRLGSIPPLQAPFYVEHLAELTDQSRDRLIYGLMERDEDLIKSIAVFKDYHEIDLLPIYDHDGKLRRVQPIDPESFFENPVFRILKERFSSYRIADIDRDKFLILKKDDGTEIDIQLDNSGSIIIADQNPAFRSINISLFREYDEALHEMRLMLKEANDSGYLSGTLPEYSPVYLDDYASILKDELLKEPDFNKKMIWIEARKLYFEKLQEFLNGPGESALINGYEENLADVSLSLETRIQLTNKRNDVISFFNQLRAQYNILSKIHNLLKDELSLSLCMMGTPDKTKYSALLANSLITGSHIKTSLDLYALFWAVSSTIIILLLIFRLRPFILFFTGLGLSIIASAAFGIYFIFYSNWIDPAIIFITINSGVVFIFICKIINFFTRTIKFRAAYGNVVSPKNLSELIAYGKPDPAQIISADAVVLVIKDIKLLTLEEKEKPSEAGTRQKRFISEVKEKIFDAGGIIAGFEKDLIYACFGTSIDKSESPVIKACNLVKRILKDEQYSWHFGVTYGKCTFTWLPETGYTVFGKPAVHAKILASRTIRLKTSALVTSAIWEIIKYDENVSSYFTNDVSYN